MKSLYIPAPYAALSVTLLHSATKLLKQGPSHTSSPQLLDSIQTSGSVSYGRTKQYKYGLEIRNNFNDMKCNQKRCNNLQVCKSCQQTGHSQSQCQSKIAVIPRGKVSPKWGNHAVIKSSISTPVNITLLEELLSNHPDKHKVNY